MHDFTCLAFWGVGWGGWQKITSLSRDLAVTVTVVEISSLMDKVATCFDCIVYLMQGLYHPGNLRSSAKCVLGCSVLVQKELRDPICQGNICVVTAFVPLLLKLSLDME